MQAHLRALCTHLFLNMTVFPRESVDITTAHIALQQYVAPTEKLFRGRSYSRFTNAPPRMLWTASDELNYCGIVFFASSTGQFSREGGMGEMRGGGRTLARYGQGGRKRGRPCMRAMLKKRREQVALGLPELQAACVTGKCLSQCYRLYG